MFTILLLFITVVGVVIWLFQVRFIHPIYRQTKFDEMQFSESVIASVLNNDKELETTVNNCAVEYHNDIWVFTVVNERATPIVEANGSGKSNKSFFLYRFPSIYDAALENGGSYMAVIRTEPNYENDHAEIVSDNMGDPSKIPQVGYQNGVFIAVSVSIHDVGGVRYAVMQISDLMPFSAMVKTLNNQFLWLGVIFLILVLLLAELLSRFITRPFVQMNRAAKELAEGRYDVEFSGHGYREINELADTLNYAAAELSRSDALQKELISNVSHDLRTPLTMIKGYSEVMRDIPGENTPENVQVIIDETERLSELVNDMLDLSRIQAGMQKPRFEAFSLTETVRDTMTRYEKLTMQDGYRILFDADGDATVYADRGMILQVIYNLINNAIHYTGEERLVTVKQSVTEERVRISVTDTGEGIAPDEIPLIWDRYYRVDRVHKRAVVGTGLGLSIVKGILEMHHAAYGVDSAQGHGSTFWFELGRVSEIQDGIEEVKGTL